MTKRELELEVERLGNENQHLISILAEANRFIKIIAEKVSIYEGTLICKSASLASEEEWYLRNMGVK